MTIYVRLCAKGATVQWIGLLETVWLILSFFCLILVVFPGSRSDRKMFNFGGTQHAFFKISPTDREGESRNGRLCFGEDARAAQPSAYWERSRRDSGKDAYKLMTIGWQLRSCFLRDVYFLRDMLALVKDNYCHYPPLLSPKRAGELTTRWCPAQNNDWTQSYMVFMLLVRFSTLEQWHFRSSCSGFVVSRLLSENLVLVLGSLSLLSANWTSLTWWPSVRILEKSLCLWRCELRNLNGDTHVGIALVFGTSALAALILSVGLFLVMLESVVASLDAWL